ncbi:hypothetical protein RN001_014264 [Aquatica leii]|uniref:C2H2-type domain-containing protein n=1 Tax=Aquatica leii TaxID=1421715 RepID=A0AAN7SEG2_9COLE|nr:hypothetical protein RN001_014264 [Aquatica leii]
MCAQLQNNSINSDASFFLVEIVPIENTASNYSLRHVFIAISNSCSLILNSNDMKRILSEDLGIADTNLRQPLLNVLEATVMHYLKIWDGWKRPAGSYSTESNFEVAFVSLRQYLSSKCNFVIQHADEYIQEICDYKLIIAGPPSILDSIVTSIKNDDILVDHAVYAWRDLRFSEFLNWPFVSVEVKLLDLHLKRNKVLFQRFYVIQLLVVLQKIRVEASVIKALAEIYHQFLEDVREMNIAHGSMCTNTTVSFQIGKQKYTRSKLVPNEPVHFVEHISPQVDLTLFDCTAVQDMHDANIISFTRLNSINPNNFDTQHLIYIINNTAIKYSCTFCSKSFGGPDALKHCTEHFSILHKVGEPVACLKCHKCFQVKTLSGSRWKHSCG